MILGMRYLRSDSSGPRDSNV